MPAVTREYNQYFAEEEGLRVSCSQASQKFPVICKLFANKWNPNDLRESYLSAFSSEAWSTLTAEEKAKHTLKKCSACKENYPDLSAAFPTPRRKAISRAKTTTIKLSKADISTPTSLGRKILQELNQISQQAFQKSGQEILIQTPKSQLQKKPTKQERRKQQRTIEKEVKSTIEQDKQECASDLVLGNRISWSSYDKLRKAEGLTPTRKRPAGGQAPGQPSCKRRLGNLGHNIQIDQDRLIEEAASWPPIKSVNWSLLAREYGINTPNGGQVMKKFLQEHNVPAAMTV